MGYQYKIDIAGTVYAMGDIRSARLEAPLFDRLSVGNACSAELEITIWPKADIPKMAKITPYVLLKDGITWYPMGVFYTDTRAAQGTALNIVAYDAMMGAEAVWKPAEDLKFPLSMPAAAEVIATEMGVELDNRTVLNSSYTVDYPVEGQTLRETLMAIAAANGGNWIITNEGKLLLIPLFGEASSSTETSYLVTEDGYAITFGGVKITV